MSTISSIQLVQQYLISRCSIQKQTIHDMIVKRAKINPKDANLLKMLTHSIDQQKTFLKQNSK